MAGLRAPLLRVQAGTGRGDLLSYCGGVGTNRTSGEDRGDRKVTAVKGLGYILGGGGRIVYAVLVADLSWGIQVVVRWGWWIQVRHVHICRTTAPRPLPPRHPSHPPPSPPSFTHPVPTCIQGGGGGVLCLEKGPTAVRPLQSGGCRDARWLKKGS